MKVTRGEMNRINAVAIGYVGAMLGAIETYCRWCEDTATNIHDLRMYVLAPAVLIGIVLFSVPAVVADVISALILVPLGYLAILALAIALRERF
jgi:hypothetical protein